MTNIKLRNTGLAVLVIALTGSACSAPTEPKERVDDGCAITCIPIIGPFELPLPSLLGVWGGSAMDVFAVGGVGTILHYDGNTWSAQASGTTGLLLGVWGSSATDVYVVGDNNTILHYDGTDWGVEVVP